MIWLTFAVVTFIVTITFCGWRAQHRKTAGVTRFGHGIFGKEEVIVFLAKLPMVNETEVRDRLPIWDLEVSDDYYFMIRGSPRLIKSLKGRQSIAELKIGEERLLLDFTELVAEEHGGERAFGYCDGVAISGASLKAVQGDFFSVKYMAVPADASPELEFVLRAPGGK